MLVGVVTCQMFAGCKDRGDSESNALSASTGSEEVRGLDAEAVAALQKAGFLTAEVKAVADSIDVSEWLGVQSFVDDANSSTLPEKKILRRESHGKAQGCLRASFETLDGKGLGIAGSRSYPAWLRLSNGGAFQADDRKKHISRGWGIKLLDVAETPTHTHDFVMLSSPIFFISDVTHYPGFLKSTGEGKFGLVEELLFGMNFDEKKVVVRRLLQKVANLLDAPLYSAVPYSYKGGAAKYALAPCSAGSPPIYPPSVSPPSGAGPDYLEDSMNATLSTATSEKPLCYFFYAQPASAGDSLDNPTHEWGGKFERVAKITIPAGQQRGGAWDYRNNADECERIAFTPWNTTEENQPVGKVNWIRRYVYQALAKFRRVDFPLLFARWTKDPSDPSIPADIRNELARLKVAPETVAPVEQDASEPTVDQGFRQLGIVQ